MCMPQHWMIVSGALLFGIPGSQVLSHEELPMDTATGTFDVKITPQETDNAAARTAGVGRNAIEKHWRGDLEGESHAEMLYSGDATRFGSYVAIEKFVGALKGRSGSFVLMHSAVMNDGKPEHWVVRVVPGSGTDELHGLSGTLTIVNAQGQHSYELSYALAAAADLRD